MFVQFLNASVAIVKKLSFDEEPLNLGRVSIGKAKKYIGTWVLKKWCRGTLASLDARVVWGEPAKLVA